LQVRKGAERSGAPAQPSFPVKPKWNNQAGKFAGWEGGKAQRRPRSTLATIQGTEEQFNLKICGLKFSLFEFEW